MNSKTVLTKWLCLLKFSFVVQSISLSIAQSLIIPMAMSMQLIYDSQYNIFEDTDFYF